LTEEKKRGILEVNDNLKKRGAADTMNADPQTVIQQALGLAEKDRAILAGLLLESLEVEPDADHEARWQAEVCRREAELDTGGIPAVPWEEVKARLRQQRHGPPED
jgi:putative addiction module component (TIGR02574 family)